MSLLLVMPHVRFLLVHVRVMYACLYVRGVHYRSCCAVLLAALDSCVCIAQCLVTE